MNRGSLAKRIASLEAQAPASKNWAAVLGGLSMPDLDRLESIVAIVNAPEGSATLVTEDLRVLAAIGVTEV